MTAWSAGIQLHIPTTPHSLSLHASNAHTTTLQGASIGGNGTLWGFEFTIPVTLSRYFGRRAAAAEPAQPQAAGRGVVEVHMSDLAFQPRSVRVQVGDTVRWTNSSSLLHTVTADQRKAARRENVVLPRGAAPFDSGMMRPGDTFVHVFMVPGEYRYVCQPHELAGMLGTIVVGEGSQ
jgi:plastocyanin